jgi:hypothetical protein
MIWSIGVDGHVDPRECGQGMETVEVGHIAKPWPRRAQRSAQGLAEI